MTYRLSVVVLLVAAAAHAQEPPARGDIQAALSKVAPALVRIHVVTVDYRQGREVKREGSGSGTIISPDGHVVTNHHVAGNAKRIVCTLASKEEIEAELVGTDPLSDISVLKLKNDRGRKFPTAAFGDSSRLKVGDRVLAMGSPLALSQSVTLGIVSNTEMIMPRLFWPFNEFKLEGEDVGSLVRWIGHDAPIYPGNSGGPLVNLEGEIIGVNEISLGLAGAIPGNLAKEISDRLIAGEMTRSWIGLEVQPLLKASKASRGALVSGTIEGTEAEKAGFKAGDILIRLNNRDVNIRFAEELPTFNHLLMSIPIGSEIDAVVIRDGKQQTLRVKTSRRESAEARKEELKPWGITATELTLWDVKEAKRSSREGVLVKGVRPGGPAEEARPALAEDDIIVEVNGAPVADMKHLVSISRKILDRAKDEPEPTLVSFERKGERYLTVVELGADDDGSRALEAKKAWVPVSVQALTTKLADRLGLPGQTGVRVTRVYPGSTAEAAGLEVGDIISAIDGEPVEASESQDVEIFTTMIRRYKIGTTVKLSVLRDRKESQIDVKLAESPRPAAEMRKYRDANFEFVARDLSFEDRVRDKRAADKPGVLIETVSEGGWAALAHIAEGDLLISVDGKPVKDVSVLESLMKDIAERRPDRVVMHIQRGIRPLFVELEPTWSPLVVKE